MAPLPPTERSAFRADIEGLRGIAILFVVAFHAGIWWMAGGFIGVDVFFVLSGYLISGLLARELAASGDVDLTTFYARRAQRLLPALIVVLLATLAIALFFYAPIDQRPIASDARAVALHYGNVLFARNAVNYHASAENPFLHTWSLAVEEQFYVIWPLLFLGVARLWTGDQEEKQTNKRLLAMMAFAGLISFVASLVITSTSQPWAFFGMPTRVWEFAIGGVTAIAVGSDHTCALTGSGGLTKSSAGGLVITVGSSLAGPINITGGDLRLYGPLAQLNSAPSVYVESGASLSLDNSGGDNGNRIGDTAPLTLAGGTLNFVGATSTNSSETMGPLSPDAGS